MLTGSKTAVRYVHIEVLFCCRIKIRPSWGWDRIHFRRLWNSKMPFAESACLQEYKRGDADISVCKGGNTAPVAPF